jgi:hypothetical protein
MKSQSDSNAARIGSWPAIRKLKTDSDTIFRYNTP